MTLKPEIVFRTPFFEIEELPGLVNGSPYHRLLGPDSVIVALFNEQAELLLVSQDRPSLGEKTLEFPAGAIEAGEKPIDAARREVMEETGYLAELFQLGDYFHLMMNRTKIRDYLFCGIAVERSSMETETGLGHRWITLSELHEQVTLGGYRQLAGLGILHLISQFLEVSVFDSSPEELVGKIWSELDGTGGRK